MKSGSQEHNSSGDSSGMVQALVELASFCDRQLRLKEDNGMFASAIQLFSFKGVFAFCQ